MIPSLTPPSPASSSSTTSPLREQVTAAAGVAMEPNPAASPPWGAARSPPIHRPTPPTAIPTTALLDARRRHFRFFQRNLDGATAAALGGARTSAAHIGEAEPRRPSAGDVEGATESSSASTYTTTTTAHSPTPQPNAVVMEALVRRYRATESRLDRWRHADSSSRAAAALRRQARRSGLQKGVSAAQQRLHRSDGARTPRSVVTSMLERSAVARAVHSWWHRARGGDRSAAAAVLPDSRHSSTRAQRLADAQGRAAASASSPPSWLGHVGRHFFGRLSRSQPQSSERGRSSRVEVVSTARDANGRWGPSGHRARGAQGNIDDSSDDSSEAEEWRDASDVTGDAPQDDPAAAPAWLGAGVSTPLSVSPIDVEEVASSSSSSSSSDDVDDHDHFEEPVRHVADPSAQRREDRRFTLAWIRGLRGDRVDAASETSSVSRPSVADESFRSASRLLAKSRARFTRWVQRQHRAQSAKRAMLSERWRRFSQRSHRDGDATVTSTGDVDELLAVRSAGDATDGRTGEELRFAAAAARMSSPVDRAVLQRVPSSWEPTVTWTAMSHPAARMAGVTPAMERALLRAALQRVVDDVAASRVAQRSRGDCHPNSSSSNTHSDSAVQQHSVVAAPPVSRAERQQREDAAALARLGESVRALASLRAGAPVAPPEGPASAVDEAPTLPSRIPASSTILSSLHSSYIRRLHEGGASLPPPLQAADVTAADATTDEADAFRSLLVDTTHTPHDTAVRLAYEAIMREVCGAQVMKEINTVTNVSRGATERALSQWVERQLMAELASGSTAPTSAERRASEASHGGRADGVVFTGILRHLQSRVPVSLSSLRLDDADRRALASVQDRQDSDTTAASLQTAGYTISFRQLASLSADAWLNDQVINNYLQLLCEDVERRQREPQQHTASLPGKPCSTEVPHRVASMGTHFYAKVESELAQSAGGAYAATSSSHGGVGGAALPPLAANSATLRWLRRRQHLLEPFQSGDAQSVRAVLIPVNIEAQHWALVVYYRDDQRWVLYDSMSRSDRAQRRGLLILSRLSHVWRECQRHFGVTVDDAATARAAVGRGGLVMAAAYAPSSTRERSSAGHRSPLDTLQPYGSVAELHRAAKRLRHQEDLLEEEKETADLKKLRRLEEHHSTRSNASLTSATTLPASLLSDAEVEWFTDGFAHAPQQRNGNDCGVFVCQVAWCVAQGVAVSFTQADVTLLRQVITLELLKGKLLRRYPTEHTSSSADV